ncbi:alpha/beta fold hydrolase [Rhizobium sp. TH2]|uniref:alpha/beta hydrolase n=1 Tax=Rhizobium sp. TH2 TaxID=2775403 RepID=UPI0021577A8D|nr:alpha/beta fold hydrolase [Rhizobium sp. TH2]UVC10125.1 alpha/beta fold hydrolase [Rhizobium sp. TH2]
MKSAVSNAGVILALIFMVSLAGCTSRPGPDVLNTVPALPGATQVKVFAVTTRTRMTPDTNAYDNGKSIDSNYAELNVSIPPGHKDSQIEWPKKGKKPNPKTDFAVISQAVLDREAFYAQVRAANPASKKVGVYVHGYNSNFQESVYRMAQMSADAKLTATPIAFSWPSQGELAGYVADKDSATYSRDYLVDLMKELTRDRAVGDVTIFGHSMGGWLVVEALRQLKLEGRQDVLVKLNVILAAPDIDSDLFRTQMAVIGKLPRPMIILVSKDDRALEASKILSYSTARVGRLDVDDPKVQAAAVEAGIVLVDITQLESTDSANHSRFADVAALYPALTAESAKKQNLGNAGAFVFDAAAATISSPFRIVSGALKQ